MKVNNDIKCHCYIASHEKSLNQFYCNWLLNAKAVWIALRHRARAMSRELACLLLPTAAKRICSLYLVFHLSFLPDDFANRAPLISWELLLSSYVKVYLATVAFLWSCIWGCSTKIRLLSSDLPAIDSRHSLNWFSWCTGWVFHFTHDKRSEPTLFRLYLRIPWGFLSCHS